jgi:Protein of unknown function (DUF2726)
MKKGCNMIDALLQDQAILFGAIIFGAIMLGVALERWISNAARNKWRSRKGNWQRWPKKLKSPELKIVPLNGAPPPFDAAQQLSCVMQAKFSRRRLLNRSEQRLYLAIEKMLAGRECDWRLMAQVSLGEILSSPDKDAYFAINSKRVDMLLIDSNGLPLHVIEYQGAGHHQGTAAVRDAVKKEALRKAGIGYHEILAGDRPSDLENLMTKLMR